MPIPPVPSSFPDLASMPEASLRRLLSDDVALSTYVSSLACAKNMQELADSVTAGNLSAARVNLSQEEEIGALHAEARALQAELREKLGKFESAAKRANAGDGMTDRDVLDLLRVSAREAEDETEDLSSSFVEGGVELPTFLKDYCEKREKFHQRQAKIERIEKQIQQRYSLK